MLSKLFVLLQAIAIYIFAMVLLGVIREPAFNALHVTVVGTEFFGLILVLRLCHRAQQSSASTYAPRSRVGVLVVSALLTILALTLGALALLGFQPSEPQGAFAFFYLLAVQFAGHWSVAIFLYLIAMMFALYFYRILTGKYA